VLFLAATPPLIRAADMKAEDVIAKHLDSIGTAEVRATAKTRIVQGTAQFKMRVGGGGELVGTSALVSEGRKSVLMIKLANSDYRGEQFVTDGGKVSVAATTSNHKWSDFGQFVRTQDQIVLEGLLGGALTTAWAMLDLQENKAKLSFDGEKKADGRPAYQLTYHSRKRDDLTIHLFFDPQTYQHLMTTYTITLASGLGGFAPSLSDQAGLKQQNQQGSQSYSQQQSTSSSTDQDRASSDQSFDKNGNVITGHRLPRTASNMPLFGLVGLLSLGAALVISFATRS
jgi:hypothetical protein